MRHVSAMTPRRDGLRRADLRAPAHDGFVVVRTGDSGDRAAAWRRRLAKRVLRSAQPNRPVM